jgi:predicted CoA-binding protein
VSAAEPAAARTVAVLGASANRAKFGNKSVRAHARAGWRVTPVNPKGGIIEGLPVARSLAEVATPFERVTVYLPPPKSLAILPEIAAAAPREVWFNPGAADARVFAAARALGLNAVDGCSIVDVGFSPAEFP